MQVSLFAENLEIAPWNAVLFDFLGVVLDDCFHSRVILAEELEQAVTDEEVVARRDSNETILGLSVRGLFIGEKGIRAVRASRVEPLNLELLEQ